MQEMKFCPVELKMRKNRLLNLKQVILFISICKRLFSIDKTFWEVLSFLEKGHESEDLKERLIMLIVYFRKEMYNITKRKKKFLKIYTTEATNR